MKMPRKALKRRQVPPQTPKVRADHGHAIPAHLVTLVRLIAAH